MCGWVGGWVGGWVVCVFLCLCACVQTAMARMPAHTHTNTHKHTHTQHAHERLKMARKQLEEVVKGLSWEDIQIQRSSSVYRSIDVCGSKLRRRERKGGGGGRGMEEREGWRERSVCVPLKHECVCTTETSMFHI